MPTSDPPKYQFKVRDPDQIDAPTPQDTAREATQDLERLLREVTRYAERVKVQVLNGAMQDALDGGRAVTGNSGDPWHYAQETRELSQVTRCAGAVQAAHDQAVKTVATLHRPVVPGSVR